MRDKIQTRRYSGKPWKCPVSKLHLRAVKLTHYAPVQRFLQGKTNSNARQLLNSTVHRFIPANRSFQPTLLVHLPFPLATNARERRRYLCLFGVCALVEGDIYTGRPLAIGEESNGRAAADTVQLTPSFASV